MSDLMGRKLLPAAIPQVPYSLHEFADEEELPEADLYMLASIRFRGAAASHRIKERWRIHRHRRQSNRKDRAPSHRENRRVGEDLRPGFGEPPAAATRDAAASGYRRAPSAGSGGLVALGRRVSRPCWRTGGGRPAGIRRARQRSCSSSARGLAPPRPARSPGPRHGGPARRPRQPPAGLTGLPLPRWPGRGCLPSRSKRRAASSI